MRTPSIRRTLLIRCGMGIGLLLAALSISVYFVVRHGLYEEMDHSIIETASILANQMEYEHGGITFEWEEGLGTNFEISDQALFQYWNEKSGHTTRSPALGADDLPKFSGPDGSPDLETISVPGRLEHARAIGLVIYPYLLSEEKLDIVSHGKSFDPKDYPHTLVVARDLTPVLRTLAYLAAILSVGTTLTFIVGFLIIRQAIRSSLTPIDELAEQVRNRSENQLDTAIILPGALPSELAPLAESFDSLLSRLSAIRSRERDFIRHASHELRTPIASLSATTELALSKDRDAAEYKHHLENCADTAADLNALVKRLSALSRIGGKEQPAKPEPVAIRQILSSCIPTFIPGAEEASIRISLMDGDSGLRALADTVLLRLVFNNLLDNAVSYATPGSAVSLEVRRLRNHIETTITNACEHMPDDLERLFEPLFRKDASRTENSGSHLGIGLTLSREAAAAMGGSLTAKAAGPGMIRFVLSLPAPGASS